jgi:hypothetical protein
MIYTRGTTRIPCPFHGGFFCVESFMIPLSPRRGTCFFLLRKNALIGLLSRPFPIISETVPVIPEAGLHDKTRYGLAGVGIYYNNLVRNVR